MERKRDKAERSEQGDGAAERPERSGLLRSAIRRLTATVEDLDREALTDFAERLGTEPIDTVAPRTLVRVGGEVRSVRLVPRAGAPALEVTIDDGRGLATGVFLGRRRISGISPGRRMIIEGRVLREGNRSLIVNPVYTLLS